LEMLRMTYSFRSQLRSGKRFTLDPEIARHMEMITGKPALEFIHPERRDIFRGMLQSRKSFPEVSMANSHGKRRKAI